MRATQVQAQLRKGNADVARGTLGREAELSELRNQIAIIRCVREGASSPRPRDEAPLRFMPLVLTGARRTASGIMP